MNPVKKNKGPNPAVYWVMVLVGLGIMIALNSSLFDQSAKMRALYADCMLQTEGVIQFIRQNESNRGVDAIKTHLATLKLPPERFIYVLDNEGLALIHPQWENQNILTNKDLDGNEVYRLILKEKKGYIVYNALYYKTRQRVRLLNAFATEPVLGFVVVTATALPE